MIKVFTQIGRGRVTHAAQYDPHTGSIHVYCGALRYPYYFAAINHATPPDETNVTCKACLKRKGEWME